MRPILSLVFLLALELAVNSINAQESWTLKKNMEGIRIYTRSVEGKNIKEYKAITWVDAPMEAVIQELLTAPVYLNTPLPDVSYLVSEENNSEYVFYVKKELPWPIRDRDVVTSLKIAHKDQKQCKLLLKALPEGLPKSKGILRVKELMGHWLIETSEEGKTKVVQQLFFDPEGTLPDFLVNSLLVRGPFQTFSDLKRSVSR